MAKLTPRQAATKIVDDIVADFTDRRGLRQAWEDLDEDIQKEIINEWLDIATRCCKLV